MDFGRNGKDWRERGDEREKGGKRQGENKEREERKEDRKERRETNISINFASKKRGGERSQNQTGTRRKKNRGPAAEGGKRKGERNLVNKPIRLVLIYLFCCLRK